MSDGVLVASPPRQTALDRSVGHVLGNTAITGLLGSLFWLVAPRVADDAAVAAAVSAASLVIVLGFVGQLNMATALSRFLPRAGESQRSVLRHAYVVAVGFSLVLSAAVVVVGWLRGGELIRGGDTGLTVAVAVALPLWTIFALQDGALVALRRASWLPVENGVTSVARIAMLPLVTLVAWPSGLLLVWLLPIVPAIGIVNHLLFSRLLADGRAPFPRRREAVRFALTDLPGVLLTVASLRLVPLVVVEAQGSEAGAHIGVAWSILTVSALALPALSRLALSEMAHEPGNATAVLDHLRRTITLLVVPLSILAAVSAPLVLRVAGAEYAKGGAVVLAAGALGIIPAAHIELRLADLRAHGRVTAAMWAQTGRALVMLAGTWAVTIAGRPLWVGGVFAMVNVATLGAMALVSTGRRVRIVGTLLTATIRLLPGLVGIALVAVAIPRVDVARIDDAGLISALPPLWFVGVALVVAGAFACLEERGRWRAAAYLHVVALVVVLHGLPGMVEGHPRFPVAWLHTGFIDQIATNGELLPQIDGRFSWAGFFSGGALLQDMSGRPGLLWLVRFTPIVVNLVAVLAVTVLGPLLGANRRQSFVASVIFVTANWIGQDYFAPQAMTFLLYLAVIALVLRTFATDPSLSLSPRLMRWLRPERPAIPPVDSVTQRAAWFIALLIAVALVMSHQLSPLFLGLSLLALALTRSISLRGFPFIVLGLFVAWLSFSAEAYWVGHLDNIIGSVGEVTSLVKVNVGERASAPSLARQLVLRSRIGLAVGLWALALWSAYRLRRQGRLPLALLCLLVAPFPPLAVQPYGGEMIMRVTLFTLPATALLCARLLAPEGLLTVGRRVMLSVVVVALVPLFVLTRFGNEKFEYVPDDDAALVDEMYSTIPDQSTVYVRNRQTVVQSERVDDVRFRYLPRTEMPALLSELEREDVSRAGAVYVMLTEGQSAFGEVTRGYPEGWISDIASQLTDTGRFTEVMRHGDAVLLRLTGPARTEGASTNGAGTNSSGPEGRRRTDTGAADAPDRQGSAR